MHVFSEFMVSVLLLGHRALTADGTGGGIGAYPKLFLATPQTCWTRFSGDRYKTGNERKDMGNATQPKCGIRPLKQNRNYGCMKGEYKYLIPNTRVLYRYDAFTIRRSI